MTNKTIITHLSPDFDAITASWLIIRYLPGWKNPQIKFIPAGFIDKKPTAHDTADKVYVDTGLGKFDHHQFAQYLSATKRVFDYLVKKKLIPAKDQPAIERIVELVTFIDNFQEVTLPNPTADIYDLSLPQIINGLKAKFQDDHKVFFMVLDLLEGLLITFKNKLNAEIEINSALIFKFKGEKCLAIESKNDEVVTLGQKMGYSLVIRRDPQTGHIRIKARPDKKIDLTSLYHQLKTKDSQATWFLHSSKKMLLNGSKKNPQTKPSHLSLQKIIEIIKKI